MELYGVCDAIDEIASNLTSQLMNVLASFPIRALPILQPSYMNNVHVVPQHPLDPAGLSQIGGMSHVTHACNVVPHNKLHSKV